MADSGSLNQQGRMEKLPAASCRPGSGCHSDDGGMDAPGVGGDSVSGVGGRMDSLIRGSTLR